MGYLKRDATRVGTMLLLDFDTHQESCSDFSFTGLHTRRKCAPRGTQAYTEVGVLAMGTGVFVGVLVNSLNDRHWKSV